MQNYAEMQWKFWTSETLTVSVWCYFFFLLLTWEVWSLIDGAILGFLAWFPDNKGFMPRPSTMSLHNLFFPNKSSSFMQRQLEIFEQIKWPPKSHCKSDSEWPAGSLANRTHSLNHCCVLLRCVSVFVTAMQPVCVDGSETVALTHYRDPKKKQKKKQQALHYKTATLQRGLTSMPLTSHWRVFLLAAWWQLHKASGLNSECDPGRFLFGKKHLRLVLA